MVTHLPLEDADGLQNFYDFIDRCRLFGRERRNVVRDSGAQFLD
jgi:hypothetical protein